MRAIAILGLVRRLLTYEAAEIQGQDSLIEAAERALDKLRVHLSKRIGQEGFRTLLARALALTTPEFPYMSAVRVGADGSLVGLRKAIGSGQQETAGGETQAAAAGTVVAEGAVALVAQFLGLLVIFIGEDLTLRLLSAVWPELSGDDATAPEDERP